MIALPTLSDHTTMLQVEDDTLLTFKEVQGYLRASRSTVYRLIWSGQLPRYYVGSTMRFYRRDVQKCIVRQG